MRIFFSGAFKDNKNLSYGFFDGNSADHGRVFSVD